jgi:hypothetical protein
MKEPYMSNESGSQKASLGCGSLILIALIVMFFSQNDDDIEREVRRLRDDVAELRRVVEAQTTLLRSLERKLEQPQIPDEATDSAQH